MKKIKRIATCLVLLALVVVIGGETFLSAFPIIASAEESVTAPSNVLDDLKKDSEFDESKYPAEDDSTRIKLIHIAESENGELFVYTYQPGNNSNHRKANYINMSLANPHDVRVKDMTNRLYSLTWVNGSGVFDKYRVDNFAVSDVPDRYYNIAGIYRPYDELVDSDYSYPKAIDSIECRAFDVGTYWHVYYYNGVLVYEAKQIEIVSYTVNASGTVRYNDALDIAHPFVMKQTDSHYVAVSFDNYSVDQIYDADITYTLTQYSWAETYAPYEYKEDPGAIDFHDREFISSKDTGFNEGGNRWFADKYTWNRIMTADEFVEFAEENACETFDETEREGLENAQYVFAFDETPWATTSTSTGAFGYYSKATGFGLLRLHFLSGINTYNLGCVGELVGTDGDPELSVDAGDNLKNELEELDKDFEKIFGIVLLVLLVVLIIPLITNVFPAIVGVIGTVINSVMNFIIWLITLPFRLFDYKGKRK